MRAQEKTQEVDPTWKGQLAAFRNRFDQLCRNISKIAVCAFVAYKGFKNFDAIKLICNKMIRSLGTICMQYLPMHIVAGTIGMSVLALAAHTIWLYDKCTLKPVTRANSQFYFRNLFFKKIYVDKKDVFINKVSQKSFYAHSEFFNKMKIRYRFNGTPYFVLKVNPINIDRKFVFKQANGGDFYLELKTRGVFSRLLHRFRTPSYRA